MLFSQGDNLINYSNKDALDLVQGKLSTPEKDEQEKEFQYDHRVPAIERYGEFCANIINRGMKQNRRHAGQEDPKNKGKI